MSVEKKVLEEEEYLGRMAKIIRRDFFSEIEFPTSDTNQTPVTDRTELSTTSSVRSRGDACSLGLNEYLEKYTSEDNAYFEKLQKKELKRHRLKYPWLYKNKCNSLFYPPDESDKRLSFPKKTTSTIHSSKYMNEPLPVKDSQPKVRSFKGFSDKIGIDGKLLNGSETPNINGYSFIPTPETPGPSTEEKRMKTDLNKFYIPNESPRDELAHRVYQEKVAKVIRTPKSGPSGTPLKTPSFRKGYADLSFSPERVKSPKWRSKQ